MTKEHLFSVTIKDFDMKTFSCGGSGGQHRDHCNTGVRLTHRESGIYAEGREERSQAQNKISAFKKIANDPKFKLWMKRKAYGMMVDKKEIERQVDEMMKDENLRIEYGLGKS